MKKQILASVVVVLFSATALLLTPARADAQRRGVFRGGLFRGGYRYSAAPYYRYDGGYRGSTLPDPYWWWWGLGLLPSLGLDPEEHDYAPPSGLYGNYQPPQSNPYSTQPEQQSTSNTPPGWQPAHIEVRLPMPDGQVWFEGVPTQQFGIWRNFTSPPLAPGSKYTYQIRARWTEDGLPREQTRNVEVRAGQDKIVDFRSRADKAADTGT
jgi:uncharacterized protein (TIGR03000 family)